MVRLYFIYRFFVVVIFVFMYFLYFILKAKIKKNIEIERVATLYSVKQPALLEDDI